MILSSEKFRANKKEKIDWKFSL